MAPSPVANPASRLAIIPKENGSDNSCIVVSRIETEYPLWYKAITVEKGGYGGPGGFELVWFWKNLLISDRRKQLTPS